MKKLLYLFLLLSTFSASAQTKKECQELQNAEKQVEANIKMYRETWDKIFNQRDIDQVNDKNFATDVILLNQKEGIRAQGIEGFKKAFNSYLINFSDIKFTFIDLWGHGDKLVKHWNFQGKHNKTGNLMNLSGVTLVKMKDGKIIEEQDFDDNLWYNQQLGYYLEKEPKITKGMIKVAIYYPNGEDKTFNMEYYESKHMTLAKSLLGNSLKAIAIDKGLASGIPNKPVPYLAIGYLYFDSIAAFQKAMNSEVDAKLNADIPNYTNSKPIVQISEVLQ